MRDNVLWGSGASQRQVQRAVERYFQQHPPTGGTATDAQVAAAVNNYMAVHPPADGEDGEDATDDQVSASVAAYLASHPPAAGQNATDAQVAAKVSEYLTAHPPAPGQNATDAQVASKVAAYLTANPPAPGVNATPAQIATAVAAYLAANPPAPGPAGSPANTLVGQVTVAEGGLLSIRLAGIIATPEITLSGAVAGERYQAFCRSYKLNGGASIVGCPPSYTMLDARSNTAGKVIVSFNAPALAIGASYELKVDIVKVNT